MSRSSRMPGAIGSDDYTVFSLILIVVGLGILGWAGWKLWHAEISTVALTVAHAEMQIIGLVSDRFSQADIAVQRAHRLCHVTKPRARSVGASGIVRPLRLRSATRSSP